MTVSRRQLAREALAEVLHALEPQKAHWYQLKAPIANEACNDRFQALFPYLGTLLSLSAELMHFVLETSGLIRWLDKKKGVTCITLVSWDHFKHEFKLHVEFTTFQFGNKRNPFIRVGSWDCYHPPVTPNDIWSMKKVQYRVPMLRIATKEKIEESKVAAKRTMKNRNAELCAVTRAKKAKVERDEERAQTLASLENHNHSQVLRLHDEKKTELLLQHDLHE